MFQSNTMSLAPKIDEVAYAIVSNDIDIAMFAETWLKDRIVSQIKLSLLRVTVY